jgi:hypothetical protein
MCTFADGRTCGGPGSVTSGCPGNSCNWCGCGAGWGGTNMAACTQAGCPTSDGGVDETLGCHGNSDCPSGYACIFDVGCNQTAGRCNLQTFDCPHQRHGVQLCNCDGTTAYEMIDACAPDHRYAHAGGC